MRRASLAAALLLSPLPCMAQPPAEARQAFVKVCSACHPVETVTAQRRTRAQWQENINSMIEKGAKGTPEEFALILEYLSALYNPTTPGGRGPATAEGGGGRGRGA